VIVMVTIEFVEEDDKADEVLNPAMSEIAIIPTMERMKVLFFIY